MRATTHRIPGLDLGRGVLGALLHRSYRGHPSLLPAAGSLRALLAMLGWPDRLQYLGNHPDRLSVGWVDNLQGVTHDDGHWFFAQEHAVWKVALEDDLALPLVVHPPGAGIPPFLAGVQGYDHYGDPDHHDGLLYVPLERSDKARPGRVVVLDAGSLAVVAFSEGLETAGNQLPWCALSPTNGMLYTSAFDDVDRLRVFEPRLRDDGDGVALDLADLGSFALRDARGGPLRLQRVQGGCFSDDGSLYLVSDVRDGGVLGFDMVTGRRFLRQTVAYDPSEDITGTPREELEGITFRDLDAGGAPGVAGQLHLVVLGNDWSDDDVWFKHFRTVRTPS